MIFFSFWSRFTLGVYGPRIYRPSKTAFNNNELIAMKFNIEIVCTQEIIMGYISLEFFSKRGVLGVTPTSEQFFISLKNARGTYRVSDDLILCNFSRES